MPWNPNMRKGVDLPAWDWLSPCPVSSRAGTGNAYDGKRYIYWLIQNGVDGGNGATNLYRFDTWSEGWQNLGGTTNSGNGGDLEYDPVRNVVYYLAGHNGTTGNTTISAFNLNGVNVTIAGVTISPFTAATLPALPVVANTGASLAMPDDLATVGALTPNGAVALDTERTATGSTATSLVASIPADTLGWLSYGFVNLYARFTTGALAGQRRLITAVPAPNILTTLAFGAAPAVGDTFVVELPEVTAASGTTTTATVTGAGWTVNAYAFQDVVIVGGTGAGQQRRIASNTADTLTLAAAVTGNARTGPFTTAPDATSVLRIVPSSDFLYYLAANGGTGLYRLDVAQTTGAAWSGALAAVPAPPAGGANLMYPHSFDPFGLLILRGNNTSTIYRYRVGTNDYLTVPALGFADPLVTGASSAILHGRRRLVIFPAGGQRSIVVDLASGMTEPGPLHPYIAAGALDGHRTRFVRTADGVEWLYHLRAQGQEFWRIPLEWMV